MRGYLDDPQSTTEAFIPHPIRPGEQVLLTKDIGMQLDSGDIRYIGRKDLQTKVRGYRVNVLEIERKIHESGWVKAAAVTTFFSNQDTRLIAAVEAKEEQNLTVEGLKKWLVNQLPEYMIPSDIVLLEHIPINHHGKINWEVIHQQRIVRQEQLHGNIPVMFSNIEKELSLIWQTVLGKGNIDVDQNFFDLGGHSLLLMEVHQVLKNKFSKKIEVIDLFKFTTIRSLANIFNQRKSLSKKS